MITKNTHPKEADTLKLLQIEDTTQEDPSIDPNEQWWNSMMYPDPSSVSQR